MNNNEKTYTINITRETAWKAAAVVFFVAAVALFAVHFRGAAVSTSKKPSELAQQVSAAQGGGAHAPAAQTGKDYTAQVLPQDGFALPVSWGDLGAKLVETGVIDAQKFEQLYASRGGLSAEERALLTGTQNGALTINNQNSQFLLNLLWALGLGNKNPILEAGPMNDPAYGGDASRFASTGGWSLARGDVMDHYSKHEFVKLTADQQKIVERVSQGIYRPCCGNSVYFPDCNHGMAMLGLLELGAAQGMDEDALYRMALQVNSFWFPDTYLTLAKYFDGQGKPWESVDPKVALGANYSSAQGFRQVRTQVEPVQSSGGGGCGV